MHLPKPGAWLTQQHVWGSGTGLQTWGWTHFGVPLCALVGTRTEQGLQEVKPELPCLLSSQDRDGAGPPAGPNSPRGHSWGMANQGWDLSTASPSTRPSVVLLAHDWVTQERKDCSERMNPPESPNQRCCLALLQTAPRQVLDALRGRLWVRLARCPWQGSHGQ